VQSLICKLLATLILVTIPQASLAQTIEQLKQQAIAQQANARYADAELLWRRVIQSDNNNPETYIKLGEVLFYQQKIEEGIAAYKQAITLKPDAKIYIELGNKLRQFAKPTEAIAAYQQAIRLAPKSDSPHFGIAQAFNQLGKKTEAINSLRQAIKLNPATDNYEFLGDVLKRDGKESQAIAAYRQAIKLDPKNYSAYISLGEILPQKEAIATYRQLTKTDPSNDVPYQAIGYLLNSNALFEQAVTAYTQAVKINPSAFNYAQLGENLMQQKKFTEAITAFQEAIAKEPNDYSYSNLASALVKQGKLNEALTSCRQVIQLRKGIYETCAIVGIGLYEKQGLASAIAAYRQFASEIRPKHMAELYIRLGTEIPRRGGTKKDAVAVLQEALLINPGNTQATEALRKLQE
jgi:superkiller protein 3